MLSRTVRKFKNIKKTNETPIEVDYDEMGGFEGQSCLIIGGDNSRNSINMKHQYNINYVVGVRQNFHKMTNTVCGAEHRKFCVYEEKALNDGCNIVADVKLGRRLPKSLVDKIKFFDTLDMSNIDTKDSAVFTILWAISKGFEEIYIAGVDAIDVDISSVVNEMNCHIYKTSTISSLPFEVKTPPL